MIEAVQQYAAVRARLNRPANAVADVGIDLKRKIKAPKVELAPISVPKVMRVVAAEYGTTVRALMSDDKSRQVSRPREIAMYLARDLGADVNYVAGLFGGVHRTTVVKAVSRVTRRRVADIAFSVRIAEIKTRLGA